MRALRMPADCRLPQLAARALACALALAAALPAAAATVTICGEPDIHSPWLHPALDAAGKPTGQVEGLSVDLARAVFGQLGYEVRFIGSLPWKRCLASVAGRSVDFAMGAYFDEERARQFRYSAPYKVLTPQIFYLAARPIEVHAIADLKRYRGCGMNGSSYAHYGLKPGDVDQGATSYANLVAKLKSGRCDYLPEEMEVMARPRFGNASVLDDTALAHQSIAGAQAPGYHLIAAHANPAAALIPQFDAIVKDMARSGKLGALWEKYDHLHPY